MPSGGRTKNAALAVSPRDSLSGRKPSATQMVDLSGLVPCGSSEPPESRLRAVGIGLSEFGQGRGQTGRCSLATLVRVSDGRRRSRVRARE